MPMDFVRERPMDHPLRRPEEILAYRTLRQILGASSKPVWSVAPSDTAYDAVRLMLEKDIGFVVVTEGDELVGVLSERDCARGVMLARRLADATPVGDVMVRNVITADMTYTFADCLRLMHRHSIRHLPIVEDRKVLAVISVRDLMGEAVAHHTKIIAQLERERMTVFTSPV
jgi:CBS domain-containing protein